MLYRYDCGCIGFAPPERTIVSKSRETVGHCYVLESCDYTGDDALGELGKIGMHWRQVKNPDQRTELSDQEMAMLVLRFNALTRLACVGAGFKDLVSLAKS